MSGQVDRGGAFSRARLGLPADVIRRAQVTLARMGKPSGRRDHQPPPKPLFVREVAAWFDLRFQATRPPPAALPRDLAAGRLPILVLPGFLASDLSTKPFRERLAALGWEVHGWGMGMNRGACQNMLARVVDLTREIAGAGDGGGKIILIGWSFGGLYAREVAKLLPDLVDRVITMGTPFSGDPRANNLWKTYEKIAGYPVDQTPFDVQLNLKPPVPTVALWSRGDGIVAPACARGLPGESDRSVQVNCSHIGYMTKPSVLQKVLDQLA